MKFRTKLAALAIGLLSITGLSVSMASTAMAGTGSTWCLTATHTKCMNAWNGGPYIKLYVGSGDGGANSDFSVYGDGNGHILLKYTGNSAWAGRCIGAAANDPNRQDTSLDDCGSPIGQGSGWGTLWIPGYSGCPSGYGWYKNVNSGGYLGPADANTNGSTMYRNKSNPYCYLEGAGH